MNYFKKKKTVHLKKVTFEKLGWKIPQTAFEGDLTIISEGDTTNLG